MHTLHYFPGSCAFVPHVALEWSGLPYRTQVETRESIKTPAYLNMNPMGQVPLLEDGGWTLTQNVAIIDYVNDLAPQAGIYTHGDTKQRAKARQWLVFANADLPASSASSSARRVLSMARRRNRRWRPKGAKRFCGCTASLKKRSPGRISSRAN